MTTNGEPFGVIRLSADQLQHRELLTGLELWLQLGLLSSGQVKQFCQQYLICAVPMPVLQLPASSAATANPDFADADPDFADAVLPVPAEVTRSSWMARALQAFMAEIGVIWLLCLGVFLVVLSSAVLAVSQWQNFSPVGQYSILFTYTLAFWGASVWTGRKAALRQTARMLQTATLLIIPVNFWMMDGLQLWQSGIGMLVNLLAAVALSGVMLKVATRLPVPPSRWMLLSGLGLSWLHWGWAISGIPLIATYVGTIGTALLVYFDEASARPSSVSGSEVQPASNPLPHVSLMTVVIGVATLLLLGRAILAAQVPLSQVGLAFGICGWLFCWLTRWKTTQPFQVWRQIGIGLLLLGWAVTVTATPPWQALAVSGLGLWLLGDRLRWRSSRLTLLALLLLGLQTYLLLWRLLPLTWHQTILTTAAQEFGSAGMPLVLLSLAGFPYLWLMLAMAGRLRQQPRLAKLTEGLALGFGIVLTLISLSNLLVRAISLSLATITLMLSLRRRWTTGWLYLNHLLIVLVIAAWIATTWRAWNHVEWSRILLLGMAIEWGFSIAVPITWRRSCWHFGLGMAVLSYCLLPNWFSVQLSDQNLIWLLTPALLTGLSRWRQFVQPQTAAWLSAVSLIAQLFLVDTANGWLLSLGVAAGLMLINTLCLQRRIAALLTVAFGLGFEGVALYRWLPDLLTFDWGMVLLAANLWLLWLMQARLEQRSSRQFQLYAKATGFWGSAIGLFSLISLSLNAFAAAILAESTSVQLVISSVLLATAFVYHLRRSAALNAYGFNLYGLAWAVELVAVTLVGWKLTGQQAIDVLAIATLGLGLVSQLAGDWVSRTQPYRFSWHLIPLLYAGLGALLGHYHFTATTGLYLLAAALIGIGVGRRTAALQPLTQIALLVGSIAAYELLIYQLLQAKGGNAGDGMTLLAGLAAAIAALYRLGQRWLLAYLRLEQRQLSWLAHLHWGWGSSLALVALLLGLSHHGFWVWLLVMASVSLYALLQGRVQGEIAEANQADLWVYAGILQALILLGDMLYRLVPEVLLLRWAAMLAAGIGLGLYWLPWRSWGWSQRPWQQMGIALPGLAVLLTAAAVSLQSLLIAAAFYAWVAKAEHRPRLSYLSVGLADWAAWRYLDSVNWLNVTWVGSVLAASLLYLAQIDPALQGRAAREQRHWLRSLAVGLLSLTLFYQAEITSDPTGLLIRILILGLAMGLVLLGLALRVRAFLYVGTIVFIGQVLRLLWLFVNSYSLLLWAVGIVLGLLLIWIAATFEARRSQMSALLQYWLNQFANWE
jgi:hypothetical protein